MCVCVCAHQLVDRRGLLAWIDVWLCIDELPNWTVAPLTSPLSLSLSPLLLPSDYTSRGRSNWRCCWSFGSVLLWITFKAASTVASFAGAFFVASSSSHSILHCAWVCAGVLVCVWLWLLSIFTLAHTAHGSGNKWGGRRRRWAALAVVAEDAEEEDAFHEPRFTTATTAAANNKEDGSACSSPSRLAVNSRCFSFLSLSFSFPQFFFVHPKKSLRRWRRQTDRGTVNTHTHTNRQRMRLIRGMGDWRRKMVQDRERECLVRAWRDCRRRSRRQLEDILLRFDSAQQHHLPPCCLPACLLLLILILLLLIPWPAVHRTADCVCTVCTLAQHLYITCTVGGNEDATGWSWWQL